MANKKFKLAMRILPFFIAVAYGGNALAQEKIEEVVVTAQKRKENVQNVPISITAINSVQLAARGIDSIAGLNAVAPNVNFKPNPGSNLISEVGIRGFSTNQPAIWIDPAVGMYVDGVYIGKAQGSVFDMLNLERVEILRGPQGTLFGRNTEGGAINFVTRRPSGVWGGSVGETVGNYGHTIERVSLDLPEMGIAKVSLGYRREDQNGWASNPSGSDWGAIKKEAYRAAADLDVSKKLKVGFTFDHSTARDTPDPTSLFSTAGWSGTFPSVFGAYLGTLIQGAMTPYVTTSRPSSMSSYTPYGLWENANTNGGAMTASYKLSDNNELKYIFSHRTMMYNDRQNISGTPLSSISVPGLGSWGMAAYYDRNTNYSETSNELQWIGNTDKLKYVAGLYLYKDDGTTIGPQDFSLFGSPFIDSNYNSNTDAKALYGQLDYALTDRWTATVGTRYTTEKKGGWTDHHNTVGFNGPIAPSTSSSPNFFSGDYSATFSANTPMAALSYKYSDTTRLYGRIAKGFKSGGFSGELTNAAVLTPYKPETSVAVEVGAKNSFLNNRAQLNVALFQTKLKDQQLTQLLPASTSSFLTNAGKSTYEGLELEGTLIPVDGWRIQASYGYLHTKFDQYIDNALNIAGRPLIDTASNKLAPDAPKNTFDLSVDGRLAQTQWGILRGIVDYSYTSSSYLYSVNADLSAPNAGGSYSAAMDSVPAMSNINFKLLLADMPVGGPGAADLSFWVRNLTNESKQIEGIDFGMFRTANWQEPRMYGVTFNYKW